ncbi:MAG: (2Fe-2S) ferredoxin domain-containing protein [Pseudomonadota bacterium]
MERSGAGVTRAVRSNWSGAVLICAKCSKKVGRCFGPKRDQSLMKALRGHVGTGKGRKSRLGIVEVKCLGVCPKGEIVVVNGCASDTWHLIPRRMAMDEVAATLGLET